MSDHLTLSGGRENLRLRELPTELDSFPPDKSLKRKKEKVVAAQPIEFELSFSPLTSMYDFYSF